MRSPIAGWRSRNLREFVERQFETQNRGIGPHVGVARTLDQRHFAEFHALGQGGEPHAARQFDADHAALQEEQRRRRLALAMMRWPD